MTKPTISLILLFLFQQAASATEIIPIDLGAPRRIVNDSEVDAPFNAAFPLNGQEVSLTFNFNLGVRVMASATSFFIVTRFDTNTDRVAPFGPVKGFLLDKEGNPLRAVTIDAFTGTNSFLFGAQLHPNLGFFDFYGVHLDFTAPDLPAASITNSFFRIGTHNGFYAIGLLPDAGSTMLLAAISLGLVFSLGAGKARRPLGPK